MAQFFVLVVAPFTDVRAGQREGSHVEAAATSRHYTHDEARCPACAARHLVGTVSLATRRIGAPPPLQTEPTFVAPYVEPAGRRSTTSPRAPPVAG